MNATLSRLIAEGHVYGAEYGEALSNHEPMALVSLARLAGAASLGPETLERFALAYRTRLERARFADPHGFAVALARNDAHAVARAAIEAHGDGLPGAAGHGLLRVYFALEAEPLVAREVFVAELAHALDHFVSTATVLARGAGSGDRELLDVLAETPRLSDDDRAQLGRLPLITLRQEAVAERPAFARLVGGVRLDFDLARALAGLARIGARKTDFTLLHGITTGHAIVELERLLPGLDMTALRRGWIAFVAAAWLVRGLAPEEPSPPSSQNDLAPVLALLGATTNDHAPKAAFALQRLHERFGDPVFADALAAYVRKYA